MGESQSMEGETIQNPIDGGRDYREPIDGEREYVRSDQ